MEIALVILIIIVITIWQLKRIQRRRFQVRKKLFKRPIWNVLNRQPAPLMCAQINLELDKIRSLPEIADVELFLILSEMVREGTLVASVHKCRIGDPPIYVNVTKFANAPGSEPPTPPRDDPEDSRKQKLTPAHT